MKKLITFALFLCSYQTLYSQNTAIDSLKKKVFQLKDTARINALIDLAAAYKDLYSATKADSALNSCRLFANEALTSSKNINYIKGLGFSQFNLAEVTSQAPENQLAALTNYQGALPFLKQYGNKVMIAVCMAGIGESSHTIGKLTEAIPYFDTAAQIVQAFGDTGWSVYFVSMKGHCYFDLGDYRNAYKVGTAALELAEKNKKDTFNICLALMQLSNLFLGAGLPQTTIEYYHKVINYYPLAASNNQNNFPWPVSVTTLRAAEAFLQLNQLDSAIRLSKLMSEEINGDDQGFFGHLYTKLEQYQKALSYFIAGFQVESQTGHLIGMARHANELGRTYLILGKLDLAIKYANNALSTGKEMHALLEMKNAVGTLLDIYTKTKNYEQVYNYSQLYKSLSDSLSSEEYRRTLSLAPIQNELDNQKQQAVLLSKDNELKEQQLSKETMARKYFIGGIIAMLLIAVIVFRSYRQKQHANIALQQQKQQIESTLSELESTQAQLIQSAKMASLGELTAGIAHEIQNPLNFVNNFSEVSNELLDEMKTALTTSNPEEAAAIAEDVKQNLQKILHHGKRAETIVKGMLQHSRSSSGTKEPTDINALADEYLRLSYHGLRSKDKSLNATLKTDFDPSIGNIPIIPQDIGRVLLNLYNNALYAVAEKTKSNSEGYEPIITVSTKKLNGKVLITVGDNGNGVPQKVVDKIFQPFFTTKPTGQGTGLGLSISYDIVKSHGGDLKVTTKEGEGSEFTIELPTA